MKREIDNTTNRFEDILTFLESVYAAIGKKKEKELEEIAKNFEVITERRNIEDKSKAGK